MNVGMNWLSNDHLELVYKGARPIEFRSNPVVMALTLRSVTFLSEQQHKSIFTMLSTFHRPK